MLVAEETGVTNRRQALKRGRGVGGRMKEGMARGVGDVRSLFSGGLRDTGGLFEGRGMIFVQSGNSTVGSTRLSGHFRHLATQPWDS